MVVQAKRTFPDDLTRSIWAGLTESRSDPKEPEMARRKNWSAEQIVAKLRQIEVQMMQDESFALACKEANEICAREGWTA
jgi:hypothetical protein